MGRLALFPILALSIFLVILGPSLADAAKPNLVIMPKSANAGEDITITGANFPPTSTVDVFLDNKKISTHETGRKGSFSTTITIPDDAKSGSHRIKVTSGDASASTNFEVKKSKVTESKSNDKQKTKQAKPIQRAEPVEDILSEIEQPQMPKTDQSKRLVNISDKNGSFQVIPNRDLCDKALEDYVVSVKWVTDVKNGSFQVLYDVNGKNEIAQIQKGGIKSGESGLIVQFSGKFAPGEYNFGLSHNNFWVEDSIVKVIIPAPDCAQVQTQGGDIGGGQGTSTKNPSDSYRGMIADMDGKYDKIGSNLCDNDPKDYQLKFYWTTIERASSTEYRIKLISEDGKYSDFLNTRSKDGYVQVEYGPVPFGNYHMYLFIYDVEIPDSWITIMIPKPDCVQVSTQGDIGHTGQGTGTKQAASLTKLQTTGKVKTAPPEDPRLKQDSSGTTANREDLLKEDSSGLSQSDLQIIKNKSGRYDVFARDLCDDLPNDYRLLFTWNVDAQDGTKFKAAIRSQSPTYDGVITGSSAGGTITIQSDLVPFDTYEVDLFSDSGTYQFVPDSRITVTIQKPNCSGLEDSSGTQLSKRQNLKTEPLTCTPSNSGQWTCTKSETKISKKSESFNCAPSSGNSLTCTSSGAQGITLNCPITDDATMKAYAECQKKASAKSCTPPNTKLECMDAITQTGPTKYLKTGSEPTNIKPPVTPSGTTKQDQTGNSGSSIIKIQNKHGSAEKHNSNLCDSDQMDYRVMLLWVIDNSGLSARDFRVNPVFPLKSLYHSDHKLESGELRQQFFATPGNHEYELTYKGATVANSKIYVTIPTPNCGGQTQSGTTGYQITDKTPSQIRDATKSPPTGSASPSTPDPQKSTSKSTTGNKAILVPKTGGSIKPSTGTGLK